MSYIFSKIEYEKLFELVFRFSVLAFVGVKVCSENFCRCKIKDKYEMWCKAPQPGGSQSSSQQFALDKNVQK